VGPDCVISSYRDSRHILLFLVWAEIVKYSNEGRMKVDTAALSFLPHRGGGGNSFLGRAPLEVNFFYISSRQFYWEDIAFSF
jgi:hypothetical protein